MIDPHRTYEEWDATSRAFARGDYPFLFVAGPPGVAKTHILRKHLGKEGEDYFYLKGNTTAYALYLDMLDLPSDATIVVDDSDRLFRGGARDAGVGFMKSICETETPRTVSFNSNSLKKQGLPIEFRSSARIAVISNDLLSGNVHMKAIEDRGLIVLMEMDASEVHGYVGSWWPAIESGEKAFDAEVFDYFGAHIPLIKTPSVRHYLMAARMKRAGNDRWRTSMFLSSVPKEHALIKKLLEDPTYPTMEQRAKEYQRQTGKGRASFFNYKRELDNLSRGLTIQNTRQMRREAAAERKSFEPPQGPRIFEAEPEPVEATQPQEELAIGDVEVVAEFRENFEAEPGAAEEPPQVVGGPMAG